MTGHTSLQAILRIELTAFAFTAMACKKPDSKNRSTVKFKNQQITLAVACLLSN